MTCRFIACALLLAVACLGSPGRVNAEDVPYAVLQAEAQRVDVMARASQAVVAIFDPAGTNGGSGVLITADGFALSNFHVTKGAGDFMKCGLADGRLYDAVIVGIDPTGDVALIKLLGREDFPVAQMADSDEVRVGDWVFAMGNPFLLAGDFQPTVTYGIVSGVHRYQYPSGTILEYADCLQTDASINPGNSGGPLFNANGQLIGINGRGSFEKRGRVNVGVGYAITINQIKHFLGALRGGRLVDHATLGATVTTDAEGRVVVSNLLEDCDAYRRGLRHGDEIVSFGGRPIRTVNAFKNVLGIFPADWRVPLVFRREGEKFRILVRLPSLHAAGELNELAGGFEPEPPAEPAPDQPDKPDSDEPQDEPPQRPAPRPKMPFGHAHQQPSVPDAIKALLVPRPGFANFYFNTPERDRVWRAVPTQASFAAVDGLWKLTGADATGAPVEIELSADSARLTWAGQQAALVGADQLAANVVPEGTGGLLPALFLWRRLLVGGPTALEQVEYGGIYPFGIELQPAHTIIATTGGVEARFYCDEERGWLIGVELFTDTVDDPCEVSLLDYEEREGRLVPTRILVRHGDQVFADWKLDVVDLAAAGEPKEAK
ncbi:MAG: trypsin-like peptidase domain-containing protein [Pirellulales bacterium]|nr:trypsin-like peptidase domain-containing protein [Pirellulales bacterium]